jgi:signal transduction histidine kinase
MAAGLYRLDQIETIAFEQGVRQRTALVSEFIHSTQTYVNEHLRPATEARTDHFVVEAMTAPYVTRNLFQIFNQTLPEYTYRQPALNPMNLINQADEFEARLIERLNLHRDLKEISGYHQQDGVEKFYIARPMRVEARCLQCHGLPSQAPVEMIQRYGSEHGYNWHLDDIVSALTISVPTADLRANQAAVRQAIGGTFLLLMGALVATVFVLFEGLVNHRIVKIGKVLQHWAATPDAVIRLPDRTKDEIGLLSRQFNHMADSLSQVYRDLESKVADRTQALTQTLQALKSTQARLVHAEKMLSLGQMVGGIAHEINNPINFIHGNLSHTEEYAHTLLDLVQQIEQEIPPEQLPKNFREQLAQADLRFIAKDFPQIIGSMRAGSERIRNIVEMLRNFARLDESQLKQVDLHEGIESTLLIVQNRLQATAEREAITVIKHYDQLPLVTCFPSQINQVVLHLLSNAIDAIDGLYASAQQVSKDARLARLAKPNQIEIITSQTAAGYAIAIADNGTGIAADILPHIFDPFFTTKPVGKGTGLGLAISHQIMVETHGGSLNCQSELGQGTTVVAFIPKTCDAPSSLDSTDMVSHA